MMIIFYDNDGKACSVDGSLIVVNNCCRDVVHPEVKIGGQGLRG